MQRYERTTQTFEEIRQPTWGGPSSMEVPQGKATEVETTLREQHMAIVLSHRMMSFVAENQILQESTIPIANQPGRMGAWPTSSQKAAGMDTQLPRGMACASIQPNGWMDPIIVVGEAGSERSNLSTSAECWEVRTGYGHR